MKRNHFPSLALSVILSSLCLPACSNEPDIDWVQFDGESPLSSDFTYSYHPEVGGFVIEDYKGDKPDIMLPETTVQDGVSGPVTGIAAYAFYNRKNLRSIALPFSIRYLGEYCFADSGVENLYMTGNLTHMSDLAFEGFSPRVYTKDGIEYLPTRETKYGFGYRVTGIEKNRKKSGKGRLELHLPNGCVGFRDHIFDDYEVEVMMPQSCAMLGTLTSTPESEWENRWETWYSFEEGIDSIKIQKFAFEGEMGRGDWDTPFSWYDVRHVDISSYFGDIPDGCFNGFPGTDIKMSEDIFSFGKYAFFTYRGETFRCPQHLKTIGVECFAESSLKSIELNDELETIEADAFYGATNLASMNVPNTLKKIGHWAFYGTHIPSLVLPESLEEIEEEAFMQSHFKLLDFSKTKLKKFDFYTVDDIPHENEVKFVIPAGVEYLALPAQRAVLYYMGDQADYDAIKTNFNKAPTYFYSEVSPAKSGNYWHYGSDGNPVIW